ncbi:sulfotransferase family protein [Psychromonas marina]|uniref:Sulfotransferase family protein n=1 Tax=Psychromonas marina TaxID=88364 RepID=A0ABQ6E4M5_9GAMM|nr:sulfotransferase family protein [Psychromonas marina]GLS92337.1 sulfotransferase family protein [Psychromonas marina]
MTKIFIIGLPRTGTTSISVALLEQGFKVAHTAFTKQAFELADAISDSPCFSDYQQLDLLFPESKFVYLKRDLCKWLPSIKRLLYKMGPHLMPKTGHFNPVLKRSFEQIFDLNNELLLSDAHLSHCYLKHEQQVESYFQGRDDLLSIDISHVGSLTALLKFLDHECDSAQQFPHLNKGTQVANWKEYKHANKINSLSAGRDHRKFFDYHY